MKLIQSLTGRRWGQRKGRRTLVAAGIALVVVLAGALSASAVVVPPANSGGIIEVGPVSGENGFPVWYKDSAGLRLEGCLDGPTRSVGSCPATSPTPPSRSRSPTTSPRSSSTSSRPTSRTSPAAPAAPPPRWRWKAPSPTARSRPATRSPSRGSASSTAASPLGRPTASPTRSASTRKSPGPTARSASPRTSASRQACSPALDGRLGPFLRWDPNVAPAAPAGYVGDPNLDHQVTGSPFGSNFVRVEGPGVATAGQANACAAGATDCIQNDLDGTGSTGPITSYSWTQTAGPAVTLTGADTAKPTFTAPTGDATLEFELTVDGAGGPSTDRVVVTVLASAATPIANAGPDQTVNQTATVTLDGTASENTTTFSWTQTGGPAVTLNGANTATPSFVAPKSNVLLTFELTASSAGGSSTDTVEISVNPDDITVTRAEYRTGTGVWRIDGTDTIFGPGVSVTIYLGPTPSGAPLASDVQVDTLGAWSFRQSNSPATPGDQTTITVVSSGGDEVLNFPLSIRT